MKSHFGVSAPQFIFLQNYFSCISYGNKELFSYKVFGQVGYYGVGGCDFCCFYGLVLGIPRMPTNKAHAQTPAYQSVKIQL